MPLLPAYRTLKPHLVMALIAVVSLTAGLGCKRDAHVGHLPARRALVVLISRSAGDPQWPAIVGGARRTLERYPYLDMKTLTPALGERVTTAELVRRAIGMEATAIAMWVRDEDANDIPLGEIEQAGAMLVTVGEPARSLQRAAHVQVDWAGGAELLGRELPDIADGKRSCVLLHSQGRNSIATACYQRFVTAVRDRINFHILMEKNTLESEAAPTVLVRQMLKTFRHAGLVVTLEPNVWIGRNPPPELPSGTRFATLGAVPALWPRVLDGEALALAGTVDGEIGEAVIELIAAQSTAEGVPRLYRVIEPELVTRENLLEFARRYAAAAGLDLAELSPELAAHEP